MTSIDLESRSLLHNSGTGILQPDSGPISAPRYLPARASTTRWGRLPCAADRAVLTIDPGEKVTIDTISHEGILEDQGRDPLSYFGAEGVDPEMILRDVVDLARVDTARDPEADGPHVVTGPIRVRGAEPGDLLSMTLLEALPRVPYGVISSRHGKGALEGELPRHRDHVSVFAIAGEDPDGTSWGAIPRRDGSTARVRFPLAPFLGIMGVATAGRRRAHSVPPGSHGGNIDLNLLTCGSTIHVPVQVPGALAYVGDPHFAQGDGEIALTAMEASLRVTVRFDLIAHDAAVLRFGELSGPLAESVSHLIPTGMDEDLDEAVRRCTRAAIGVLRAAYGMDEVHAYAYLSAATDFRITQVVDVVKGAHAMIRKSDFRGTR